MVKGEQYHKQQELITNVYFSVVWGAACRESTLSDSKVGLPVGKRVNKERMKEVFKMKTVMHKALAVAVIAGVSGGAMAAAHDGDLGGLSTHGSSTGYFNITLYNAAQARIFGLKDFTFAEDKTGTPIENSICIYTNTEGFTLTTSSQNGFKLLSNSKQDGADYTLALAPASGGRAIETWGGSGNNANDVTSKHISQANISGWKLSTVGSASCSAGNFKLLITPNVTTSSPGVYTDLVTLTVTPA
ncbi:hypothetical protein [Sansalvadorimonas verongulae]|uniref:hypothetical protein n=1 Tax=Sansalvadorimonas verongulae TaxID=2172824 RepID=UPI0012BC7D0F|nr:hypothetical protein [Sansalvadorimonas verongulae]MTI11762.1 hypothetical protein [Sansalvadorimonas verongulae]